MLQSASGKICAKGIIYKILRQPSRHEDFVNLLCFLDPKEAITLIDVGANVGEFTSDFRHFFPNTKAILFEPIRSTFETVSNRYAGDPDTRCINCALSAQENRLEMFLGPDSTLSSLEKFSDDANANRHMQYDETEIVDCKPLDSFCIKASDNAKLVLKVDVQGHEVEVFEGAEQTLANVDICLVECSFANEYEGLEPSFAAFCEKLRKHGLYPVIFQDIGRTISNYGYERDVIFVKSEHLNKVYFKHYGTTSG